MALSSLAATARFMSRSIALQRTVAPASLAKVLSGASARVLNLPERLHAAQWRPVLSNRFLHSHTFSVTCKGLSRTALKGTHSMRRKRQVQNVTADGLGQRHTIGPTPRSSGKCVRKMKKRSIANRVATHLALLGRFPEVGRPSSICATQVFRQNLATSRSILAT